MDVGCINDVVLLAMVGMKDAGAVDVAAVVVGWCDAIVEDHIHKISMVMIAGGADCASNGTACKMFAGRIFVPDEPELRIVVPFRRRLLAGYSCPMSLTADSGVCLHHSAGAAGNIDKKYYADRRRGVSDGFCNRYSSWHPDPTSCHFSRSRAPEDPGQVSAVVKNLPHHHQRLTASPCHLTPWPSPHLIVTPPPYLCSPLLPAASGVVATSPCHPSLWPSP
jgi:hypothetical protein